MKKQNSVIFEINNTGKKKRDCRNVKVFVSLKFKYRNTVKSTESNLKKKGTRNSRSLIFFKIGVIKIFTNLKGKHLRWRLFLIKSQTWGPATLFERDSNTFFTEHLQWLLLKNRLKRKFEISPVYMTKVTGLQRKKLEKERMVWSGDCLRLQRRYIN